MQPSIPDTLARALDGISPGYQLAFKQAAGALVRKEILGTNNPVVTRVLAKTLAQAARDRRLEPLLSKFFQSLTPDNRWLLRHPTLMQSWSELAAALGCAKTYMGVRYMELWAAGGIGKTPSEMRLALCKARDLLKTDPGLALNFLIGYDKVASRLDADQIDGFIAKALHRFARQPEQSYAFLQVRTKAAQAYLERFSRHIGVSAHKQRLTVLLQSIAGAPLQIEARPEMPGGIGTPGGQPPLMQAGTVYLPARFDPFDSRDHNFEHLQLAVVTCATAYAHHSFCRDHGQRGMTSGRSLFQGPLASDAAVLNNLLICTEIYRVLFRVMATYRGLAMTLRRGLKYETARHRANGRDLLFDVLDHLARLEAPLAFGRPERPNHGRAGRSELMELIRKTACSSASYLEVVSRITSPRALTMAARFKPLLKVPMPLSFFPDYNHPFASAAESDPMPAMDAPPRQESAQAQSGTQHSRNNDKAGRESPDEGGGGTETVGDGKRRSKGQAKTGRDGSEHRFFYYDEWNQANADYYPNWVRLKEIVPRQAACPGDIAAGRIRQVQRIKQAFEQVKPDRMRKKKFLLEGDAIDTDLLIEHLCSRKAGFITDENYYQKPYVNRRDLAVALLLDLSGSTGSQLDSGRQVIDMEKEAAFILGEGLAELGDRFGIFGFTGQGRLGAEYFNFKGFDDAWTAKTQGRLFNAATGSTTRMGVAIRHTGHKLGRLDARKKLVLVITDGKPMDAEYSPHDGYAQFDVAKAVGELKNRAIDVFCISTEENKVEDLEIMFSFQRFAIIKSMADLPRSLTRFYLKLTS